MINLEKNEQRLEKAVARARENNIVIPTIAQMKDPAKVPEKIKAKMKKAGLWDFDPVNLFRISWKNEQKMEGGLYGGVNYIELPSSLTGVRARIVAMTGKWFPTG